MSSTGETILEKIGARAYTDYHQFRADLTGYLEAIAARNSNLPDYPDMQAAWLEALDWLNGDYWTRFKFDAASELLPYKA